MGSDVANLLKQKNNVYSIVIKNPDGTQYTFYEGVYFPYSNTGKVLSQYSSLLGTSGLKTTVDQLAKENRLLRAQLNQVSGGR